MSYLEAWYNSNFWRQVPVAPVLHFPGTLEVWGCLTPISGTGIWVWGRTDSSLFLGCSSSELPLVFSRAPVWIALNFILYPSRASNTLLILIGSELHISQNWKAILFGFPSARSWPGDSSYASKVPMLFIYYLWCRAEGLF